MDKSIIMFDTPDSCGECFCQKGYTVYGYACGLTNRMNKDARCRPVPVDTTSGTPYSFENCNGV